MYGGTVVSSRRRTSICGSPASTLCGLRDLGRRSSPSRTNSFVRLPCVELALFSNLRNICCVKRPDETRRCCLLRMLSHCMGVVSFHFAARHLFRSMVGCAMSVQCRVGRRCTMQNARSRYTVDILNYKGISAIPPFGKDTVVHLQRNSFS